MSSLRPLLQMLDLAWGVIGFLAAYFIYDVVSAGDASFERLGLGLAISILTFWFCTERQEGDPSDSWLVFIELVSLSTGLNLIIQALLTYFALYPHIPLLIIFVGGLLSGVLLTVSRGWVDRQQQGSQGVLLVGFDPAGYELTASLGQPILGVVESDQSCGRVPDGLPVLGTAGQLAEIVSRMHPSRIVVTDGSWESGASARTLVNCRLSGIEVTDIASLQEKTRYRVSAERIGPPDFLLSPELMSNRQAMAVQAIYTNLFGLAFLLLSVPLLVLIVISVKCFSGPGPAFEAVECLGFQNIPFYKLRFRTRRQGMGGQMTAVGRIISCLHLVNLPQLANVVRGEMALVGPPAVRRVFAERLTELMPYYSHRFTVKPGLLGWARLQLGPDDLASETVRIGYDLYYVKEGSPAFDLEILARFLSGRGKAGRPQTVTH